MSGLFIRLYLDEDVDVLVAGSTEPTHRPAATPLLCSFAR